VENITLMASNLAAGRVHDRVQILLAGASGRRCRLQGLNDASLHYGWVQGLQGGNILVEAHSKKQIKNGDFLYLEVHAPVAMLVFVAYVTKVDGNSVSLQISSEVEDRPLKSESRMKIDPISGHLKWEKSQVDIVVRDVSDNGFGFATEGEVKSLVSATTVLKTTEGEVTIDVEVRHARFDKDLASYVGGCLVKHMDRVSRARWGRVLGHGK
jgi:hypothetical protein